MKKRINAKMMQITVLAIVLTLLSLVAIFYNLLKEQVMNDLHAYVTILKDTDWNSIDNKRAYSAKQDELRITVISPEGDVIFDNMADPAEMENHKDRPEFKSAIQDGEGEAVRKSETLSRNTYYYAVRLDSGNVLRVAKESSNSIHILLSALPLIVIVFAILLTLCISISRVLTRKLVRPIEEMAADIDHMENVEGYEELDPFIKTINEQHKDILKNANMRQEFTANVSHELKTPLTSISGYSELIENGMVSEKDTIRFAQEIHRNANRLLTLINDIIRLSELDYSMEPSNYEQVDLFALAESSVSMLQMNASKHDVTLKMTGKKCMVYGNRQMLEEVLYNLCDNAIRYNVPNGSVVVTVDEEDDNVFLSVKDTGIGISEEHQDRIFERFYRVDKSRSKQTGGTGLGLAIVKHIIAQHKANLTLSSQVGVGTEIKVVFL